VYLADDRWADYLSNDLSWFTPAQIKEFESTNDLFAAAFEQAVEAGNYKDDALGRAQARRDFEALPSIAELERTRDADIRSWWEAHPLDLLNAIQSGAEPAAQWKEEILQEAGLID
jgi:hypothetical protein